MKYILAVIAVIVVFSGCGLPPLDVPRAGIGNETVDMQGNILDGVPKSLSKDHYTFEFEGYMIAKSHKGSFDVVKVYLTEENGSIAGFKVQIQADSVNTGIEELDTHLIGEDFFDAEQYPEINFVSGEIPEKNGTSTMSGLLTFHGVTKEISFPVTKTDKNISADFMLDTTPFEMKYAAVNKEVRISFSINLIP